MLVWKKIKTIWSTDRSVDSTQRRVCYEFCEESSSLQSVFLVHGKELTLADANQPLVSVGRRVTQLLAASGIVKKKLTWRASTSVPPLQLVTTFSDFVKIPSVPKGLQSLVSSGPALSRTVLLWKCPTVERIRKKKTSERSKIPMCNLLKSHTSALLRERSYCALV